MTDGASEDRPAAPASRAGRGRGRRAASAVPDPAPHRPPALPRHPPRSWLCSWRSAPSRPRPTDSVDQELSGAVALPPRTAAVHRQPHRRVRVPRRAHRDRHRPDPAPARPPAPRGAAHGRDGDPRRRRARRVPAQRRRGRPAAGRPRPSPAAPPTRSAPWSPASSPTSWSPGSASAGCGSWRRGWSWRAFMVTSLLARQHTLLSLTVQPAHRPRRRPGDALPRRHDRVAALGPADRHRAGPRRGPARPGSSASCPTSATAGATSRTRTDGSLRRRHACSTATRRAPGSATGRGGCCASAGRPPAARTSPSVARSSTRRCWPTPPRAAGARTPSPGRDVRGGRLRRAARLRARRRPPAVGGAPRGGHRRRCSPTRGTSSPACGRPAWRTAGFTSDNLLVSADGRVHLLAVRSGEVAATDLALRIDVAQLLTALALVVGTRAGRQQRRARGWARSRSPRRSRSCSRSP